MANPEIDNYVSKRPAIYTVAHLNWEGDGIIAVYRSNQNILEGDQYHDDIGAKIDGFFLGLNEAEFDHEREDIYVSGNYFDDCYAPETLAGVKDYPWTEEPD